ncbi:MAG: metallophosphoesterase [Acidimicrobiales bacterium]|nr:metallophosphoesterase [Acidimicrobiales bacterium]MCB9395522.1 metallophosphoesterase [Acidimicrobiaceae bacterium]
MRIAAVGDIHLGADSDSTIGRPWAHVAEDADVVLLAGDLTKCGTPAEARLVIEHFGNVSIPVIAVLGNHDHHAERDDEVTHLLRLAGIQVLEGDAVEIDLPSGRLGVAGVKGFGGGFAGANATAFGEREMKAFVHHTELVAERLAAALGRLTDSCDVRVALMHYSPTPDTLCGERPEIHPFLGSQLLAEAVDATQVDLVVHGHAHAGTERGATPGGIPVRNVAMPVIGCAYRVFDLAPAAGGLGTNGRRVESG